MEYRGTEIKRAHWHGKPYYTAWYLPKGKRLRRVAATDDHPVGIMRAVDDWLATGRPQHRTTV